MRAAGIAALGLWSMAGAWSSSPTQMTDGWIPLYWIQTWPGGKKAAEKLVQVGLWKEESRDGLAGYQFHDWEDFQRTAASWEAEKRKARERMKNIRSGSVRPNNKRTFDRTQPEGAAHVPDSLTLTLTPTTHLEGEGHLPARASTPPKHCKNHINEPATGTCGPCGDARRLSERWEADERAAVRACRLCTTDGQRIQPGTRATPMAPYVRCDHKPLSRQETA